MSYKVHIVDDDKDILNSFSELLKEEGFFIETSSTGKDALSRIKFDVHLIDIKLPDMDGLELLKHLQKENPDSIKIVMTGFASVKSAVEALNYGANSYLIKPIKADDLLGILKSKLNERELEKKQTFLRSIIDNTPDIIWLVDKTDFGLLDCNESFKQHFLNDRKLTLTTGMRPADLFPTNEYIDQWHSYYERALQEGTFTTEYQTITGNEIFQLTFNAISEHGEVFGISVFGKNITEKKEMEKKLLEFAYRLNGLSPGSCFLSGSHERLFKAYVDLTFHGVPGLCIAREDPELLVQTYGVRATEIRLLSSRPLKGFTALTNLQTISLAISDFLHNNKRGVVLLDGLEYLVTFFGFEAVYKLIQEKRFDFLEAGATLIVPVDVNTLSEKERALFSSELKLIEDKK